MKKTFLVSALLIFPALTFAGGFTYNPSKVDLDIETSTAVKTQTNNRYMDYIGNAYARGVRRGGITYLNSATRDKIYNPSTYRKTADGRFVNINSVASPYRANTVSDYAYYRYGLGNPVLDVDYDWTQDPGWRTNLNWRLEREPSEDEVERIIRRMRLNQSTRYYYQ